MPYRHTTLQHIITHSSIRGIQHMNTGKTVLIPFSSLQDILQFLLFYICINHKIRVLLLFTNPLDLLSNIILYNAHIWVKDHPASLVLDQFWYWYQIILESGHTENILKKQAICRTSLAYTCNRSNIPSR